MHNNHTLDGVNKDITAEFPDRDAYLELVEKLGWKDPLGAPQLVFHENIGVIRDDMHPMGTKGRWGDLLVQTTQKKVLVYVGPRVGFAGISLAQLCQKYDKKLILFCPAAKLPSDHQLRAMELGAELRFVRIAAMPVLNKYAKEWAKAHQGEFLPLGLKHPLVTAAGVKSCYDLEQAHGAPEHSCSVISTGVLSRALQIGWPTAKHYATAMARNLKAGEAGRAEVFSHPQAFKDPVVGEHVPPFPSVITYDAKGWQQAKAIKLRHPNQSVWFWNVAAEPDKPEITPASVNSQREWGDKSDLERGL